MELRFGISRIAAALAIAVCATPAFGMVAASTLDGRIPSGAADKGLYYSGADVLVAFDLTSVSRGLLGQSSTDNWLAALKAVPACIASVEHADGTITPYRAAADTDAARGTALLTAIAACGSGETIVSEAGTCALGTTTISMASDRSWVARGTVLTHSATTNPMILLDGVTGVAISGKLTLTGLGSGVEIGIKTANNALKNRLSGVIINNMGGSAGAASVKISQDTYDEFCGNVFDSFQVYGGYIACDIDARGEYNQFAYWKISGSAAGFYNNGGNNTFLGCHVTGTSGYGIYVGNGFNNGHGQWIGGCINHNAGYGIQCVGNNIGFTFTGMHCFDPINLDGCGEFNFTGGIIGLSSIVCAGTMTGVNTFDHVVFRDVNSFSLTATAAQRAFLRFYHCSNDGGDFYLNDDLDSLLDSTPGLAAAWISNTPGSLYQQAAASTPALIDSAAVGLWASRIYGRNLSESTNLPYLQTTAWLSQETIPTVAFDGGNDVLLCANAISTANTGTVVCVVMPTGIAGPTLRPIWGSCSGSAATHYMIGYIEGATGNACLECNGLKVRFATTALTDNTAAVISFSSNGSAYAARVNGVTQTVTAVTGSNNGNWFADHSSRDNFTFAQFRYNSAYGALGWFQGLFGGVVVLDGVNIADNLQDVRKVERALAKRYRIKMAL